MESRDENGHNEQEPRRNFLCHTIEVGYTLGKLYCSGENSSRKNRKAIRKKWVNFLEPQRKKQQSIPLPRIDSSIGFPGPGRCRTNAPDIHRQGGCCWGSRLLSFIAPRIGAARDVEEKMPKWNEGMEPRFISWNVAAMHTFDFTFPDAWSRKKIKAPPSRRPGVSVDRWNDVYTPADDWSRLK